MGGIGALLDISRRALQVQATSLRVLGNNIANVNTPGYNRRNAEIVSVATSGAAENGFGQGSAISRTVRVVDSFYDRELLTRTNDRAKVETQDEFLGRAESLFPLDGSTGTIGSELTGFFSSLEDLTANPSNIALRQQVIDHGNSLVTSIRQTYGSLASLQREADTRIGYEVSEVNRIASEIAQANVKIAATETATQQDLTLRDQRDQLLRELAEKISFNTVEDSSGAVLVTLDNGFGLVTASTSRQLSFTPAPSFDASPPPALDGGTLGYIVYDNDPSATTQDTNIGALLAQGGGTIAGLLKVRGNQALTDSSPFDVQGDIPEVASRVEAISRWLLSNFNTTYRGADEDGGTAGNQPSSFDLNGANPQIYGMFDTTGGLSDANGNLSPDDLAANLTPTQQNFSSILSFKITDPRNIAAAYDLNPAAGATSWAPGDSTNLNNLIALRNTKYNFSVGHFTASQQTIEDVYNTTVSYVGGIKGTSANELSIANDREAQMKELRNGVSGVSLDEEFANLINYQRAFEAAARMVKTSDDLLGEIIGLLQ